MVKKQQRYEYSCFTGGCPHVRLLGGYSTASYSYIPTVCLRPSNKVHADMLFTYAVKKNDKIHVHIFGGVRVPDGTISLFTVEKKII